MNTMNESSLFFLPPPSPATTSMTASQLQQWIVPNQQYLMPPITRSEWLGQF
jgi:hypothetical protein